MEGNGRTQQRTIAALWSRSSPSAAKPATPGPQEPADPSQDVDLLNSSSKALFSHAKGPCTSGQGEQACPEDVAISVAPEATPVAERCEVRLRTGMGSFGGRMHLKLWPCHYSGSVHRNVVWCILWSRAEAPGQFSARKTAICCRRQNDPRSWMVTTIPGPSKRSGQMFLQKGRR